MFSGIVEARGTVAEIVSEPPGCRLIIREPQIVAETAVADAIAAELRALGLEVHVEEAAPGRPNVIADWIGPRSGALLILEGHSDVVTEGDPSAWSVPPFGGVVAEGR